MKKPPSAVDRNPISSFTVVERAGALARMRAMRDEIPVDARMGALAILIDMACKTDWLTKWPG